MLLHFIQHKYGFLCKIIACGFVLEQQKIVRKKTDFFAALNCKEMNFDMGCSLILSITYYYSDSHSHGEL
jgi:hypothetical protein